jgi:hypothetical protein
MLNPSPFVILNPSHFVMLSASEASLSFTQGRLREESGLFAQNKLSEAFLLLNNLKFSSIKLKYVILI